jgi:hypothetical protein
VWHRDRRFPMVCLVEMTNRGAQRWPIRRVLQGWQKPTNHTMLDYGLSKSKAGMKENWGMTRMHYRSKPPTCMWRSSCIKWSVLRQIVPDPWFADREACLAAILDATNQVWFRSDSTHLAASQSSPRYMGSPRPYKQLIGNRGYGSAQQGSF